MKKFSKKLLALDFVKNTYIELYGISESKNSIPLRFLVVLKDKDGFKFQKEFLNLIEVSNFLTSTFQS